MATNPLYNTNDSPNNATQPTKSVNNQGVYVPRTHNTFDISYFLYKTQKFGQYEPFFATEGVPGDTIPLSSSHNVRALPMSSPFLSQLDLNKDYFLVPNNAIQPNTWDYIYTDPSQGDDVPEDAHNLFPMFRSGVLIDSIFKRIISKCLSSSASIALRSLLVGELFFSAGSLLNVLGFKLNPIFSLEDSSKPYSFDNYFDSFCRSIILLNIEVTTDNFTQFYTYDRDNDSSNITLLEALSLLRRYGSNCEIIDISLEDGESWSCDYSTLPSASWEFNQSFNIDRLCAYQLVCAQFYVNPKVDFLYNAQLYRDNIFTLLKAIFPTLTPEMFSYNGILVPYDYMSLHYAQKVVDAMYDDAFYDSKLSNVYDYLSALFGYRESLRFGDYFTDSRTRPLAIGDDTLELTDDSKVSVIDMSRKIVLQRFRNAVIKLGQNAGDYLRGIFGTSPSPDYHVPKFISHQDFNISGFEVSNTTSENQGNIVTNLSTRDDKFAFEIEIDMPCVVIGVSYFSCPRAYSQTKERVFFHKNRYDMFNPMLQAYGDQAVYNNERTDLRPSYEVFGYQSRNNEYKQKYSQVSGGFVQYLPAWSFVTDSLFNPVIDIAISDTQSPDYIRAHDYEFNRFFQSIPGYSLASSFHFIVVYNNKCMATRPMEVNPNTL